MKELDERDIQHTAKHPFLYFVDGHISHISFKLFQWCKENGIELITFFPNATHILQMCDVAIFGAMKGAWTREVQKWKIETKNREVRLTDVVKILKRVQDKVITPETIINGFRATGIYPLNAENCRVDRCLPKESPAPVAAPVVIEIMEESSNDSILHSGKILQFKNCLILIELYF